jgi:hypothetical protein
MWQRFSRKQTGSSRDPNGSKLGQGPIGPSIAIPSSVSHTHRIFVFVIMQKNDLLMQHKLFPTVHSDLMPIRISVAENISEDHTHQDKGLFLKGRDYRSVRGGSGGTFSAGSSHFLQFRYVPRCSFRPVSPTTHGRLKKGG